jgi:hypothetical protein
LRIIGTGTDAACPISQGISEQFQGVEARPSADIYSLGKVLVFLLTGQTDADHVTFTAWRELISPCVRADADTRPAIDDMLHRLGALPS